MKILFIVPYAPNLIRVRPYQLLCALVERQHQVTVATLWSTEEERADLQKLSELGVQVAAQRTTAWRSLANTMLALPTRTPLQAVYSWEPALAHNIRALLQTQTFDVVHVEHLRGARYGLYAQSLIQKAGLHMPVVWDSVDCISHLFEQAVQNSRSLKGRLLTGLDLKRTRRYEGKLVHQFDRVLVTSATDRAALERLAEATTVSAPSTGQPAPHRGRKGQRPERNKLHVLPNGVDLGYFTPNGDVREPATVTFSGKMSYHANLTAALHLVNDIMPQVWRKAPQVKVCIVGKDPSPQVRALEQQPTGAANRLVTVTGTVADLRPYLQYTTIAVAPIPYGAGIQNKVLEAMACAAPVIASPQASSALEAKGGQALLVAQNADTFAETILHLLDQPGQRTALGQAGRAYVEHYHSWHAVAVQLEAIYQAAIQEKQNDLRF